jgi:putative aldouronate transport system substrate-binding protein
MMQLPGSLNQFYKKKRSSSMRRLLFALVIVGLAITPAFATGESEPEPAATGSDHPFGPPMTITTTGIADVPPDPDGVIMQLFTERYNVVLEWINVERSNYSEMLALKISTGEIPDKFALDGNVLQYTRFVEQGALAEIDLDQVQSIAPTYYANQEPYFGLLTVDDGVYAFTGEKQSNQYPLNAIWRSDWLENVGIDKVPETLEEAEVAFYAFTNDDPDGNGQDDTYGLGYNGLDMVFGAFGGIPWGPWPQYWLWLEDGEGGLQNAAVMPGMKDALEVLAQWYADGVIDPEYVIGENKGGYWAIPTDFFNDKIGFTGLGHYYHWAPPLFEGATPGRVLNEFIGVNPDAEIAYGTPVVGPNGDSGTWLYPVAVGAAGMTVFGSTIEDSEMERLLAIMEDQMTDYDVFLQFQNGIEGTHWFRDEASQAISVLPEFSSREARLREGIQITSMVQPMEFQGRDNPLLTEWADEHYRFPGYENKLITALPSESQVRPELERLRDQYFNEIIMGVRPVDDFDEFVEQWNAAGGAQLKAEADEWWATVN